MADNIQGFIKELAFEEALTHHLLDHGWNEVIKNPTEEQLVQNWADMIRQYRNLDTLDRETLLRLIDKIEVGEKKIVDGHKEQEIRIHYKFVGFIQ